MSSIVTIPTEGPDEAAYQQVLQVIRNDDDASYYAQNLTCQVQIDMSCWMLTSFNHKERPKTMGGDEYYIAFTSSSSPPSHRPANSYTAVARIHDCRNGTYQLDFVQTPASTTTNNNDDDNHHSDKDTCQGGILTVFFQYSMGIGQMPPPTKQSWKHGGYYPNPHYPQGYTVWVDQAPPMRPFVPSTIPKGMTPKTSFLKFQEFDLIVAFGDSTMEQFVRQRPNTKGKYFFQPNLSFMSKAKVKVGLNSETLSDLLEQLEQHHGSVIRTYSQTKNVAILVGSCLWDILDSKQTLQGRTYANHRQACIDYITAIHRLYPRATILWKSPTAVHIHVVDMNRLTVSNLGEAALFGIERLRYMSHSRSKYLHDLQKDVVQRLQAQNDSTKTKLYFVDVYDATYLSADWLFPSDGRHYRPDLNRLMLSWFYGPSIEKDDDDDAKPDSGPVESAGKYLAIPKPYFIDKSTRLKDEG